MISVLLDALLDTLKLLPYLFVTFLILEFLEHKISKKSEKVLQKNQRLGPIFGGILGALPQCGFSAMASNLFSSRIITMGTLIAVFLATSDEMLPIMISEQVHSIEILKIICFKVIVGILIGFLVDLFYKRKIDQKEIHHVCEKDHCHCDEEGIFPSSLKHTLKIGFFLLVANLVINFIIFEIGEDSFQQVLLQRNIFSYFIASIVGLIPNCASSVIVTKLYLSQFISIGTLLSALLTGSGLGILLLFKSNHSIKENITVLSIVYVVGVFVGMIVDFVLL